METVVANLGRVRREAFNGRSYLVADAALIVPGVLNGSDGALYYSSEEVSKDPSLWNGMPIVVYHPTRNGRNVSARDPEILKAQGVGNVYRAKYDGKLKAEAWFDEEATLRVDRRVHDALISRQPLELSTGLFLDQEKAKPFSVYNGRSYDFTAKNYRPDHLAILPDQVGACSVKDGCGILVNASTPQGRQHDWEEIEELYITCNSQWQSVPHYAETQGWEPLGNAFCPTGEGGGIDASCSPTKSKSVPVRKAGIVETVKDFFTSREKRHDLYSKEVSVGERKYVVIAGQFDEGKDRWEVSFGAKQPDGGIDMHMTGKSGSSAVKVMREIGSVVEGFIREKNPKSLEFSSPSREKSRVGLYERAAKLLAVRHGYDVTRVRGVAGVTFRLDRKTGINNSIHTTNFQSAWDITAFDLPASDVWEPTWEPLDNAFCPTGEGGGIDASCSPGGKGRGKGKSGKDKKATGKGEMAGHPLAGKTEEEKVAILVKEGSADTPSGNPRGYNTDKFPKGVNGEKLTKDVREAVAERSKGFDRPTIRQVFDAVKGSHPGLGLHDFQSSLAKMLKDQKINLHPYTLSKASIPDKDAAMPVDREVKYYMSSRN